MSLFISLLFLAAPLDLWDLSSPTRDWTLGSGNVSLPCPARRPRSSGADWLLARSEGVAPEGERRVAAHDWHTSPAPGRTILNPEKRSRGFATGPRPSSLAGSGLRWVVSAAESSTFKAVSRSSCSLLGYLGLGLRLPRKLYFWVTQTSCCFC